MSWVHYQKLSTETESEKCFELEPTCHLRSSSCDRGRRGTRGSRPTESGRRRQTLCPGFYLQYSRRFCRRGEQYNSHQPIGSRVWTNPPLATHTVYFQMFQLVKWRRERYPLLTINSLNIFTLSSS